MNNLSKVRLFVLSKRFIYFCRMFENMSNISLPSEFAETIGLSYAKSTTDAHKKNNGQFLTPKLISDFMAGMAKGVAGKLAILDPGCGTAILSCSLIEKLVSESEIEEIDLDLYETDEKIVEQLKLVIGYLSGWLSEKGVDFSFRVIEKDFILENKNAFLNNSLFGVKEGKTYDFIISNPPYFKISKSDERAVVAKELVYGQPNIYSLFMGLAAKLLKDNGELIFITPRSFASGNYFLAFRNAFFNQVSISNIHIFESRNKMFKADSVLQENVILRASRHTNYEIVVSVSESDIGLIEPKKYIYRTDELVNLKSREKILFIPSNEMESETLSVFRNWTGTLNDYNIQISTGPVVAFRCKSLLINEGEVNKLYQPLIWLHNVKEMKFVYPLKKANKPDLIVNSEKSAKVLLKNKNYVFLRRFSSKDDKSRLVCCPYFQNYLDTEFIGVENHLNYIHRPKGNLLDDEIWGISALYSSSLFDTYFRTFNGNTQVGASELRSMKLPPLKEIKVIGSLVKMIENVTKKDIDGILNQVILDKVHVENRRSAKNTGRVGVA